MRLDLTGSARDRNVTHKTNYVPYIIESNEVLLSLLMFALGQFLFFEYWNASQINGPTE